MAQKNYFFFRPNYVEEQGKIFEFLSTFEDGSIEHDSTHGQHKYMIALQQIANGESKRLNILTEDLQEFFNSEEDAVLVDNIFKNTKRYTGLFAEAADRLIPQRQVLSIEDEEEEKIDDFLTTQRDFLFANRPRNEENSDPSLQIPPQMSRKYELNILRGPNDKQKMIPLRNLKSDLIGSLIMVRGMVTKVTEVKPLITVACYLCDVCGFEIYQTVSSKSYTPIADCPSKICSINKTRGKLLPNHRASKYVPYQEVKVQETSDQIPPGSIPRTFKIAAKGENTRQCTPGDIVRIQGIFLPAQFEVGKVWNNANRLIHDTYIDACQIIREKKRYVETDLSQEVIEKIETHKEYDMYSRLARSIAPEIYGMDDVKKALLLLMVGGSTMQAKDGLKIRGDINIALIGDPGVAKSQLLKQISNLVPRGIYTTGKGSSGVGLTAAVMRDPDTKEIVLEGGALVLADMGVCCIDEFDKMDDYDRTAIHEVMEQQSVSIAKAGITTTLNARTSILAAANPIYGRYNRKMTPHQNINLPAALLSRFDLVFLLLDKPDRLADELLARHIGFVHQHNTFPQQEFEPFDATFMRAYVSVAKRFNPTINNALHSFIIQRYVDKRKENVESKPGYAYTTPRTLLAIVRLAQAMAKLRFSEEVDQDDVDEALRLMEFSQASVNDTLDDEENKKPKTDNVSAIFALINEMCNNTQSGTIRYSDLERRALSKGYIEETIEKCIRQYSNLNVIMVAGNGAGRKITLV